MIAGSSFEGDDVELSEQQQEVYGAALGVILKVVDNRYRAACTIVGVEPENELWQLTDHIDHRTLQRFHDRLAAAWRHSVRPIELTFGEVDRPRDSSMYAWTSRLGRTLREWWDQEPELVRQMIILLQNQNQDEGYRAEEIMEYEAARHFRDIEWERPPKDPY